MAETHRADAMKNPFAQMKQPIQLSITGSHGELEAIESIVEDEVVALTRLLGNDAQHLPQITAEKNYGEFLPREITELRLLLPQEKNSYIRSMIAAVGPGAVVEETKLADIDWVAQVQKDFHPFNLGCFYVYGSHAKDTVPGNRLPLLIDAVAAFGTGEHDTTAGCLLALEETHRTRPRVQEILDVGCGTVILGTGAARLWKGATIEACDNDPVAVRVSRVNLKANRISSRAKAWVSDGYKNRPIQSLPQQEVIVANILARPLMKMARDAARKLRGDGVLILSGLLHSQEMMVLAAHRAQGLYLKKRIRRGRWSILILTR
ncbi:MAG: 50S ribosomal protein L11 methyltransferase [Rickettsiales bacterium]